MNVYVKSVDADSVKAMKALELVIVRLNVRRKTNPEKQNADKGVETEVSGGGAWTGTSDLRPSGRAADAIENAEIVARSDMD